MSQQHFYQFVADYVPSWRRSQLKILALCVGAMVLRRRCTLSALARGLPATTSVHYRLKRLARFVDNPRLDLLAGCKYLAGRAAQLKPDGWLPVLLDETGIRDRATLLSAVVPFRGRALPLGAIAFSPRLIKRSLWALREGLIACIRQGLGKHAQRLVVVADRGFAASHFFRRLHLAKVHFVIRVSAKVYVQWSGLRTLLSQLELREGCHHWLPNVYYGPKRAPLNILIIWRKHYPQPWVLASSLEDPAEVERLYGLRMRIEAFFKDGKEYFGLEACQLHTGARICILAFALSLAFWWLALEAPLPPEWESQVRLRGKLSYLSLALEWLNSLALAQFFLSPAFSTPIRRRKSG